MNVFDPNDIPEVSAIGEPATDAELHELSRVLGKLLAELAQVLRVANGVLAEGLLKQLTSSC